jgi:C-terminal processing protease CtpA/Prc
MCKNRNAPAIISWLFALVIICTSCGSARNAFDAGHKFPVEKLQRDYTVFREVLEESHPSIDWYIDPDSMRHYFDWGYSQLRDSMTEPQFRSVLSYVIAKVHCGHTSTRYSKEYIHYLDTADLPMFPMSIKVLDNDTVILNNTLKRSDITIPRGTVLTRFEGQPIISVIDSMSGYIPGDGYNRSYLNQTLSNRGAFGAWLRLISGLKPSYEFSYLDSVGTEQSFRFRLVEPPKRDSSRKSIIPVIREKLKRRERREEELLYARSIQIDTALSAGYMTVNTFNNHNRLTSFFKGSFRELRKGKINNLVIDIRSNGGGNVKHSTLLTRFLADKPFKLADSLYAVNKRSKYGEHIQYNWFTGIFFSMITKKKQDGKYHFGYFERHVYKPKKKNHYNGNVYVLTGPNSFSAAALFARAVKGQQNIKLVGEETGGASYGNSAWFIPDVTLPETHIRFRLPKFRLVIDKHSAKDGRGVLPDIEVKPTRASIMANVDPKVELVRELIISNNGRQARNK